MTTIFAGKSAAFLHKVSRMSPAATQTSAGSGAVPLMVDQRTSAEFERLFLPHLDAAYNLARLLMRNAEDAGDLRVRVTLDVVHDERRSVSVR